MQIWHVGRISHSSLQPGHAAPLGPTDELSADAVCFAYDEQGNPGNVPTSPPVAMTEDDIQSVIGEFVQAAENALQAGLDGVEVHAANGYLFDQFLNSVINTRSDAYGGSVENRCRFLLETVDAVSHAIGSQKTGVRISPNGRFNAMPEDPGMNETFVYLAQQLADREMAFLHINDQRTFGNPAIPESLLPMLRKAFSGPIMLCGGYDTARARQAMDDGLADLIAFGVPFIANPDLVERFRRDAPLNEPDASTFYGGGEKGYIDYPTLDQA